MACYTPHIVTSSNVVVTIGGLAVFDFLPYKPGGCLKSCVFHPITNAMIENGCSLVFPPLGRESNPFHTKHGMVIDPHPVASAPFKALKCFYLFDPWPKICQRSLADKFKPPALRVVVDFTPDFIYLLEAPE